MPDSRPGLALLLALGACAAPGRSGERPPTFADDVAPVLYRECADCHYPGGPGPFSVYTYEEASARAALIAHATGRRYMPPWLPSRGYARFEGERSLTGEEIRMLARWAAAGAPPGDLSRAPAPPERSPEGWQLGEPDVILEPPPYQIPASGEETYRNFVLPTSLGGTRWVRAAEIRPGHGAVVHHARLMVDTTRSSAELDAADEAPGFDGMDLVSAATNPDGSFVGWTPGKRVVPAGEDLAWPLPGGADLVLQLHLRPNGTATRIRPRVGLYLAPGPPERRSSLLMLGSQSLEIPAGERSHAVVDEFRLPVPVEVLSVYPHAHYLAKRIQGYATLPDGERRDLLLIESWDFNWQDEYRFAEPVALPAGTVITMHFTYDNSSANPANPHSPARHVSYGSRSTDEMADLLLQVLPRSEADRVALEKSMRLAQHAKNMAVEARQHADRGDSLLAAGRPGEALEAYRESLRLLRSPRVLGAMARVLLQEGDAPSASLVAEQAVALSAAEDPRLLEVLARAYAASGRPREAREAAQRAIEAALDGGLPLLADSLRSRLRDPG